jgi:hypothetical protein
MRSPARFAIPLVTIAFVASVAAPSARAAIQVDPLTSTVVTGFDSFGAILAGPHRVFVSGGTTGSSVAIFDLDGVRLGSLTNIPGPSGMVTVDGILYVAAFGASKIFRYDLSTDPPTRLTSFSTAPLPSPRDLVYAGHRLWFTSGCDQWGSGVGRMPLDDGAPVRELEASSIVDWSYCTAIEHGPAAPNRIFLHNTGVTPQNLFQYDVRLGRQPKLINDTSSWEWGSYNGAPAVPLPGTREIATAWTGGVSTFQLSDLFGPTFTYEADGGAGLAIATTPHQGRLLAASTGGPYSVEIHIWQLDATDPIHTVDFADGSPYGGMFSDDLAFSVDGTRVYAVSGAYYGDGKIYLHVIDTTA